MPRKYLIFFLTLCVLFSFVQALDIKQLGKEDKYIKVEMDGKIGYTQEHLLNSKVFIFSDKWFYTTKNNQAKITFYVTSDLPKTSRVTIISNYKSLKILDVNVNGNYSQVPAAKFQNEYSNPLPFQVLEQPIKITMTVEQDSKVKLQEFDIKITDSSTGEVYGILDPIISEFAYLQKVTLKTTLLEVSVTNDHSVLIHVKPDNALWATRAGMTNANGINFFDVNGDELAFDVEDYNSDGNMWVHVKITDTFSNLNDLNIYLAYGGDPLIDYSDGLSAYPADYNAFWQFDSKSGGILYDATGKYNGVVSNSTFWRYDQKIDGGYYFGGVADANVSLGAPKADFTIIATIQPNSATQMEIAEFNGAAMRLYRRQTGDCAGGKINFEDTGGNPLCSNGAADVNVWTQFAARYTAGDNNRAVFTNGGIPNSTILGSGISFGTIAQKFYIGVYSEVAGSTRWNGNMADIKYFNRALSKDEIKLIYLSDFQANDFVTFGGEIINSAIPDANLTEFYSYAEYKGGEILQIPFRIQDPDTNTIYIDLNYSVTPTQGTGTVILDDENSLNLNCDSNDLSAGGNCFYNWTIPSVDGNYYILISARDSSQEDFNFSNSFILIDSTVPILSNVSPSFSFDKNILPFDYNILISDSGSGALRCITRVYYDLVPQFDINIDANAGLCAYSFNIPVACGTYVNVGFYGVDEVNNISASTESGSIRYTCAEPDQNAIITGGTGAQPAQREKYINNQRQNLGYIDLKQGQFLDNVTLVGFGIIVAMLIGGAFVWLTR